MGGGGPNLGIKSSASGGIDNAREFRDGIEFRNGQY